jgi:hypothetical protein
MRDNKYKLLLKDLIKELRRLMRESDKFVPHEALKELIAEVKKAEKED